MHARFVTFLASAVSAARMLAGASLATGVLVVIQPIGGPGVRAQQPLSLEEALREARVANALLPLASGTANIARTQVREAKASRFPRVALQSGLSTGAPLAYTTSQGQLQATAGDTLFSGGLRRANLAVAQYRVAAADAGIRLTTKDIDLAVRVRFSEFIRAEEEIAFRQEGIDRLRSYLAQIEARRAAGQPVGGDILTANVRLGGEEALLADASRAVDEARLELNDLLGRDPTAPLRLAPLPPPLPPASPVDSPWTAIPDLQQAAANRAAAEAAIGATRAERRPQVLAAANFGALPVFGRDGGTGLITGSGVGVAVAVGLSFPVWDAGVFRARLERAQLEAVQARDTETVLRRQAHLSWEVAESQGVRAYAQVEAWARVVPNARDAYLQTASMYAGGTATALEVLDAYAAWISASAASADAVLQFRQAQANAIRWGSP